MTTARFYNGERRRSSVLLGFCCIVAAFSYATLRNKSHNNHEQMTIVDEAGYELASLFDGRAQIKQQEFRGFTRAGATAGSCQSSGMLEAFKGVFEVQVVEASYCTPSGCGAHYMTYELYDCPPACPQVFKWFYSDPEIVLWSDGWKYSGAEQCRIGGCGGCEEVQCSH